MRGSWKDSSRGYSKTRDMQIIHWLIFKAMINMHICTYLSLHMHMIAIYTIHMMGGIGREYIHVPRPAHLCNEICIAFK